MQKNLVTVLLLFITVATSAQKGKFEYGFQGGINLNSAYGGGDYFKSKLHNTTGISIGVHAKWNVSNHFGIKMLTSYDQFGFAIPGLVLESGVFTNTRTDFVKKLSYINLPVLAEYSFGKKVKLKVDAGVYTGFLIRNRNIDKTQPPVPVGVPAVMEYNSQSGRKFSFGLAYGLGVEIPLNKKLALNLDARNYIGLTGIEKNSGSIKVTTLSLLSGLTFRL